MLTTFFSGSNTVNPRKISQEGTVIDPEKKVVNIKYLELFK